jgi:chromosome segregation protein
MRLKKIEVLGFKSFADRQVVVVDDHVTCVIGPNGCGKSNIVDAIRWCMGEQSAKHLRGSGMADVIFAGCSSRGPAGLAEVTLTFANEGTAPPPYGEMTEIALTRRLFADGTSEYLINKVPARLRDITDLLAGTGVGTKGYSIIEQGQVGKIVGSKPEERRSIIDEAAGITRFKAQKAAASRKIEATRQNLLRIRDVTSELDERLGTLRRQAQKAERYKKYRTELRDLELWQSAQRLLELHATRGVLDARRTHLLGQIDDVKASLAARDAQISTLRVSTTEVEHELVGHQQHVFDVDNRIRLREAEDDYRRRERESQLTAGAQARAEAEGAARAMAQYTTELAALEQERTALDDDGDGSASAAVTRLQAALTGVESELWTEQSQRDAAAREIAERQRALSAAQARASALAEALAASAARTTALQERLATAATIEQETIDARATVLERIAIGRERLGVLRDARGSLDVQRSQLKEQLAGVEVELDMGRAEVHRARSRLQSLEEIQSRYRSCASGVQVVMEHAQQRQSAEASLGGEAPSAPAARIGIIADHLDVPQHLEAALSAVLGDRLEGIVVDDPSDATGGIELLKRAQEGRLAFVPRTVRVPSEPARAEARPPVGWSDPSSVSTSVGAIAWEDASGDVDTVVLPPEPLRAEGVLGRLVDLVRWNADLGEVPRALVGDTVVVDGLPRALELWASRAVVAPMVTLDGDRLDPTGIVTGGSPTALNAALLQQKREIRDLQEIAQVLGEAFEQTRARHLALAGALADVEAARERNDVELLDVQTSVAADEAQASASADALTRLVESRESMRAELDAALVEAERQGREHAHLEQTTTATVTRVEELERDLGTGTDRVAMLGTERDALSAELTEAKVELARWQQRSDALSHAVERLIRQEEGERARLDRLRHAAEAAEARAAELDVAASESAAARDVLVEESRAATALVHATRERHDALRLELDELEASVKNLRVELDEHRERSQEVEIGLRENTMERTHLDQDVRERLDVDLHDVLVDFHDRPLFGGVERERALELRRVISRMGEVNLTAIDEFEEVSVRYEYLTRQRDDLETSLTQLQEAIDRIDKTTRQMFRETFAAVNEKFQQIFPRLFAGGRAEIKLTNPDDLLETGVEIVAQPPGKSLRSLDLLSGGEKALTAVSLIFAIFLIKPSPFCLLDEVDAPLDEVNVGRFCGLVRELAATTQFIIITHNKVSMEIGDRLYGVTMEQRGVSKLVAVNMRRAVELAYN